MNSSASVQSIAGFFSRPNFRALSSGNPASAIVDYAREVKVQLLADAFDAAYEELWNNYRSEYIYKNELLSKIVFGRHSPKTASFLSEFRVANSIADAAIFNGTSTVYEIKTEYDSLDRLRTQIEDYRKVFDYSYVVTSKSRLKAVEAIAPHNVGILFFSERGAISCHKKATSNIENVSPRVIFGVLRREEYVRILKRVLGWECESIPPAYMAREALRKFEKLSPIQAHSEAVSELKKRTTDASVADFALKVPRSLRALAISEPLSFAAQRRLLTALGVCV